MCRMGARTESTVGTRARVSTSALSARTGSGTRIVRSMGRASTPVYKSIAADGFKYINCFTRGSPPLCSSLPDMAQYCSAINHTSVPHPAAECIFSANTSGLLRCKGRIVGHGAGPSCMSLLGDGMCCPQSVSYGYAPAGSDSAHGPQQPRSYHGLHCRQCPPTASFVPSGGHRDVSKGAPIKTCPVLYQCKRRLL